MIRRFGIVLGIFLVSATFCRAQNEVNNDAFATGVYGGGGKLNGGGVFLSTYRIGPFRRILNPGVSFELGLLGPTPKTEADGVFSFNYRTTYLLHKGSDRLYKPGLFYLTGGYSGLFTNGHGVNYGGGLTWRLARPKSQYSTISLEYREVYLPGWGRQPGFRLAFGVGDETE
jgi:hypothetical protein